MKLALVSAVALGSLLGGSLRGIFALLQPIDAWLPWSTLFVNTSGSLLMGLYAGLSVPGGRLRHGQTTQHFWANGFCGGYTTFSIFSLESLRLLQNGQAWVATGNVMLSVMTWMFAVWLGYAFAVRLYPPKPLTACRDVTTSSIS